MSCKRVNSRFVASADSSLWNLKRRQRQKKTVFFC